ncbi:hypothetical protein Bccel_2642 [Pseudobacteroides cellulosolvens ATCC 35603 = DSM 2933]|uniref:Uncharacterized protein n=1 Tax=Pseudobacteroides cellulosolvens ATCC 35603 = DSM 2933 TaxID=398512 RepID=A0A0L6JNH4_9FIRM|nr:hypothetical protein Bccel_2642 [Pseudobacteroides cellulosolvens ATCC 35603 = DSM 2933]
MESWVELDDIEYRKVWDKFYLYLWCGGKQMKFKHLYLY